MNKNILTILTIVLAAISFTSCGDRIVVDIERYVPYIPDDVTRGVVINGVRWATRNVGTPGTFADAPESFGSHFQWNRRTTLWADNWNGNDAWEWARANDPCPQGWRVPTGTELNSLLNAVSRWITVNGVYGMLFGTTPHYIFLPAAGLRSAAGIINAAGILGFYWSSSFDHWNGAGGLELSHGGWGWGFSHHPSHGFSVRCVAQ